MLRFWIDKALVMWEESFLLGWTACLSFSWTAGATDGIVIVIVIVVVVIVVPVSSCGANLPKNEKRKGKWKKKGNVCTYVDTLFLFMNDVQRSTWWNVIFGAAI